MTLSVSSFSEATFVTELQEASNSKGTPASDQINYLARYCGSLSAKTVVKQLCCSDRHYADEFALYYSRMQRPPENSVVRFHLFSSRLTRETLDLLFDRALVSEPARRRVQTALSAAYLGFVGVRPLPEVPIGRTVLRKLKDTSVPPRDIWSTSRHHVYLGNLRLEVDGLAFQQQDVAVGACATAALWSALSRVTRWERVRPPTPAEVSQAAARHVLHGRTLPAEIGLTVPQLCEAIRTCGFAPQAFKVASRPDVFCLALHTYLLSGIPVVLALRKGREGHAITAVGFQMGAKLEGLETFLPARSAWMTKLYAHDDRLGPYARMLIRPLPASKAGEDSEALTLSVGWPGGERTEEWVVESGVAPVYPMMRLSVRSLINLAKGSLLEMMEEAVGPANAKDLTVEFVYKRSGEYLMGLSGRTPCPGAEFVRKIVLPRWCALIKWYVGEIPIAEFVFDTTDIVRCEDHPSRELLRGIVCLSPDLAGDLRNLASEWKVACLAG